MVFGDFNYSGYRDYISQSGGVLTGTNYCKMLESFAGITGPAQYNSVGNVNDKLLDLIFSSVNCVVEESIEQLVPLDTIHHPALVVNVTLEKLMLRSSDTNDSSSSFVFSKADLALGDYYLSFIDWSELLTVMIKFYKSLNIVFPK